MWPSGGEREEQKKRRRGGGGALVRERGAVFPQLGRNQIAVGRTLHTKRRKEELLLLLLTLSDQEVWRRVRRRRRRWLLSYLSSDVKAHLVKKSSFLPPELPSFSLSRSHKTCDYASFSSSPLPPFLPPFSSSSSSSSFSFLS